MIVPLSLSKQAMLTIAFEGFPADVRADMHKHAADLLRPLPYIRDEDVAHAAEAALDRYAGGFAP